VLGFHGCDRSVAEQVFAGALSLKPSLNEYDWLGHGIYFWENSPARALDYAHELRDRPERSRRRITEPAVVGAVIDLGVCLNLLDMRALQFVKEGYEQLLKFTKEAGLPMPKNQRPRGAADGSCDRWIAPSSKPCMRSSNAIGYPP